MRSLQPSNRVRIGMMGTLILTLIVVVGQSFTSAPMLFAQPRYYGQFANTGQLNKGDKVRITGVVVGKVEGLKIDGDHVVIEFSTGGNTVGTDSRLAIKTDTILGKKVLEIEPRGSQTLRPGGVLPLSQSTTPYQLYDANTDITKAAAGWNIDTVKQSLNVLSQTVNQTYSHLSPALDGLARFSDTIGKRDEEITHLLAQADKVASVLGDRSAQINRLLVNAKTLLAAFNERGRAIDALLGNVSAFSAQVKNLINDNPNLNPVLEQLRAISDVLVARKDDLAQSLRYVGQFAASLGETVSSGPYFKIVLSNLLPYWILQPWVDAAFKKRGIDPEDFWRSAGLPAFKFPDPNGTRFSNGAPPPAPPVLEGTPDHPGPAVAPGSPCSYAPPPELLPRPGNPMPCAGIDQNAGPVRAEWAVSGVARRRLVAAEPQRIAPDTGDSDRRATRAGATRRARHPGADRTRTARGAHRATRTATGSRLRRIPPRHPRQQHGHPDPRPHRDPAGSCRHRSSATQVEPEAAA